MNAMRSLSVWAGLVLVASTVLLAFSAEARAEMWCRRDFDRDNPVCVFASAQDCVRAADIAGGVCERERIGRAAKPCRLSPEAGSRRSVAACGAS